MQFIVVIFVSNHSSQAEVIWSFEITSAEANLERLQCCPVGVSGRESLKGKPETNATLWDSLNLA